MSFQLDEVEQMLRATLSGLRDVADIATLEKECRELGVFSILAPEAIGGVGLGHRALAIALEAIARVSPGFALRLGYHNIAVGCITGQLDARPEDALQKALDAEWLTLAMPTSGAKTAVAHPGLSGATQALVMQANVLSLVEIDQTMVNEDSQLGLEGLASGQLNTDGTHLERASWSSEDVDFTAVRAGLLVVQAAVASGVGAKAAVAAVAYAGERSQFGRPISAFQAIQWMLAENAADVDSAWLASLNAATALEAESPRMAQLALQARIFASDAAVRVSDRAIQVHGGYGYTREYPVEGAWRAALTLRDMTGSSSLASTSDLGRMVIGSGG